MSLSPISATSLVSRAHQIEADTGPVQDSQGPGLAPEPLESTLVPSGPEDPQGER